ncbi:uncharacterized protein LOC110652030 [Hevea brasiliensis]|uniref:uncharacterized protein LOC110652030 n=1 Tax=Hevea brasiliensis TaxID=3981 RepID=UPI0025FB2C19|nr:uncharacterized protein LOC110652030 [Hevea brasiliensis]
MEMEDNHITHYQQLEVFDILKEALKITGKNISFLIITLFASLPLFFFSVYYEILLQTTLVEAIKILTPPPGYYNYNWPIPAYITKQLHNSFSYKLIQLLLLSIVPLHLLKVSTVFLILDLASKIYTEKRSMTLKEMVNRPIRKGKLRSAFITSTYVFCLATCTELGLTWLVTNYYVIWRNTVYGAFFAVIYGLAFVLLLTKYLEWSALWNVSIVISILEDKVQGAEAFALSALLIRGNKQQGRLLMLLVFAWGLVVRLPCLCVGCDQGGNGILVQMSLYCIGNVTNWLACLVYFYDCKRQKLEKKDDQETGKLGEK